MKKLLVTIFSLIYLTATAGITLQRHFCMNKLVGWSLFSQPEDRCSQCGMDKEDKENGCCKDEDIKVKIGEDQQASFIVVHIQEPDAPNDHDSFVYGLVLKIFLYNNYATDHGPPSGNTIPVFLLNRVFRI